MNDLGHISTLLWKLFRAGGLPDELLAGGTLRCAVDDKRGIELRFQPRQQRWLLGVDQAIDTLGEDERARWQEALLRVAHTSRWTAPQVGALDTEGRISLVDCDFPGTPEQAAMLADAAAIEGRLAALLHRLETLSTREAPAPAPAAVPSAVDNNAWLKA
jgi:hypothetical protein